MTEKQREVRAKQASLPAALHAPTIATMEFGQERYTVSWAMYADKDGLLWLEPDFDVTERAAGTSRMRVELREDGYHVWPVPDHAYRRETAGSRDVSRTQSCIPVAVLHAQERP